MLALIIPMSSFYSGPGEIRTLTSWIKSPGLYHSTTGPYFHAPGPRLELGQREPKSRGLPITQSRKDPTGIGHGNRCVIGP